MVSRVASADPVNTPNVVRFVEIHRACAKCRNGQPRGAEAPVRFGAGSASTSFQPIPRAATTETVLPRARRCFLKRLIALSSARQLTGKPAPETSASSARETVFPAASMSTAQGRNSPMLSSRLPLGPRMDTE